MPADRVSCSTDIAPHFGTIYAYRAVARQLVRLWVRMNVDLLFAYRSASRQPESRSLSCAKLPLQVVVQQVRRRQPAMSVRPIHRCRKPKIVPCRHPTGRSMRPSSRGSLPSHSRRWPVATGRTTCSSGRELAIDISPLFLLPSPKSDDPAARCEEVVRSPGPERFESLAKLEPPA